MNWRNITFDWNHARAFLATAEEGSLSAAARALGQTQPTVGRQVAALEAELGVQLFERVGRGVELTLAGRSLRTHVGAMRDAAEQVSLTAAGQAEAIEGRVAITASDLFSALILPPVIEALHTMAPKLVIDIVADNDLRDLQRREADIALRHIRPEAPELIARLLGEGQAHFVAAASYLARRGVPQSPEELSQHDFVAFGDPKRFLSYFLDMGLPLREAQFCVGSENGTVAWEMVKRGLGVIVMDDVIASRTPGIERLLPQMDPIRYPYWLTTHRELHTSRKIRLVYDVMAEMVPKLAGLNS